MSKRYDRDLIVFAKKLRNHSTPQENRLWYDFLASYPIRFQRQKVIDRYIVDFYCHEAALVIEVDGAQHYDHQGRMDDADRTMHLEQIGLHVIRLTNRQIEDEFDAVCRYIDRILRKSK